MKINTLSIDLIRDIILHQLGDAYEERINIYNQKFKIPPDENLFVVIEYKGTKILSSRNIYDAALGEIQELNTQEMVSIGVFSRNLQALQKKELVVMALHSMYSQQVQEENSFHIARIAPIQDVSYLEGSAMLYRFDISVVLQAWYENLTTFDYYNKFNAVVWAKDGDVIKQDVEEISSSSSSSCRSSSSSSSCKSSSSSST